MTRKVVVGHRTFTITFMDEDDEDYGENAGLFDPDTGIELLSDQDPAEMASTLLHEMIHAVFQVYRIPAKLSEETACRRLEGPLLMLLRDNTELFADMINAVTNGKHFMKDA